MNTTEILKDWQRYCDAQGFQKEAQAARLGLEWFDYDLMLRGKRKFPEKTLDRMTRIIEGRDILDQAVLSTSLLKDMERFTQRCLNDKLMVTLAAPTGQGKTLAAKYLAGQYGCKYFATLVDLQKRKGASIRSFVRELSRTYNIKERSTNSLRHLINKLQSDTRSLLIIDEAQRLITEDWGYFKVLQDLLDNVNNLSIMLLGNYRFYSDMFTSAGTTYHGVSDQEQFLRRISIVEKLPRLSRADVKLWCDYNNIKLKPSEHQHLADYFAHRAALSDLENVRKEIIRIMGAGKIKSWAHVTAGYMIAIYKKLHTEIEEIEEGTNAEEESIRTAKNVA